MYPGKQWLCLLTETGALISEASYIEADLRCLHGTELLYMNMIKGALRFSFFIWSDIPRNMDIRKQSGYRVDRIVCYSILRVSVIIIHAYPGSIAWMAGSIHQSYIPEKKLHLPLLRTTQFLRSVFEFWTKWRPFCRLYFSVYFLEWKYSYFDENFTEVCPWGSSWQ